MRAERKPDCFALGLEVLLQLQHSRFRLLQLSLQRLHLSSLRFLLLARLFLRFLLLLLWLLLLQKLLAQALVLFLQLLCALAVRGALCPQRSGCLLCLPLPFLRRLQLLLQHKPCCLCVCQPRTHALELAVLGLGGLAAALGHLDTEVLACIKLLARPQVEQAGGLACAPEGLGLLALCDVGPAHVPQHHAGRALAAFHSSGGSPETAPE